MKYCRRMLYLTICNMFTILEYHTRSFTYVTPVTRYFDDTTSCLVWSRIDEIKFKMVVWLKNLCIDLFFGWCNVRCFLRPTFFSLANQIPSFEFVLKWPHTGPICKVLFRYRFKSLWLSKTVAVEKLVFTVQRHEFGELLSQ